MARSEDGVKRPRGTATRSDYASDRNQRERKIYDERGDSADRLIEVNKETRDELFNQSLADARLGVVMRYSQIVQEMVEQLSDRNGVAPIGNEERNMIIVNRSISREDLLHKLAGFPAYLDRLQVGVSVASMAAYFLVGRTTMVILGEKFPDIFEPLFTIVQIRTEELASIAKNPAWFIFSAINNFGAVRQYRQTQDIQIVGKDSDIDQRRMLEAVKDLNSPASLPIVSASEPDE